MDQLKKEICFNAAEEKAQKLITAIFLQALNDALICRNPRASVVLAPIQRSKTRKPKFNSLLEREKLSFRARQFINRNHPVFSGYCDALGIEPSYLEKNLWKIIRKKDNEV